jgi:hypothetical protein
MVVTEWCKADARVFFPEDVRASLVDVLAALRLVGVRAAHKVSIGVILKKNISIIVTITTTVKVTANYLKHFKSNIERTQQK